MEIPLYSILGLDAMSLFLKILVLIDRFIKTFSFFTVMTRMMRTRLEMLGKVELIKWKPHKAFPCTCK